MGGDMEGQDDGFEAAGTLRRTRGREGGIREG